MDTPRTIAEQRKDLLRQVVFNRPDGAYDNRELFAAEIGLTVHAYMADVYAEALAKLDPIRAEEVAQELADVLDDGALPEYAWDRAIELGHDPRVWAEEWQEALRRRAEKTATTPA